MVFTFVYSSIMIVILDYHKYNLYNWNLYITFVR